MSHVLNIAKLAALVALAALCLFMARLVITLEAVARQVPSIVHEEAGLIRRESLAEVRALRADLRGEVRATRRDVLARADSIERMVDAHAERIESLAVGEIRAARADVVRTVQPVVGEAVGLLAEYRAIPQRVGARLDPWTECKGNGACWQSQFTAVLGASRATLGQVAQTAPRLAASVERSALASEKATAATAAAMTNIAEVTKPLPRFIRVPLQIMAPTAPLWLPFTIR